MYYCIYQLLIQCVNEEQLSTLHVHATILLASVMMKYRIPLVNLKVSRSDLNVMKNILLLFRIQYFPLNRHTCLR